jgi:quercetin dioxygenase-like cupin family protein
VTALARRELAVLLGALAAGLARPATAAGAPGQGAAVRMLAEHDLPDLPGKAVTLVEVAYAPGGSSPAHRHHASASILACVVEGEIRSAVNGGEERVYRAGETWFEPPGSHHTVSANASATAPARLLAFIVADKGAVLTTYDG